MSPEMSKKSAPRVRGKLIVMLCTEKPGGMSQVVAALRESSLFRKYRVRLLVTHDRGSVVRRTRLLLKAMGAFTWLLVTGRVAVVHAHVAMRGSFWRKSLFLGVAALCGRPTVIHLHGSEFRQFYEEECGPFRRSLIRLVLGTATVVIVLSPVWQRYVQEIAPAARIHIVRNFVDLGRLQQQLRASGTVRSTNRLLFLGELGRRKGIYDLLSAVPRIAEEVPNVVLVAGGTGELDDVMRHAAEVGAAQYVQLPGWVTGDTKARLLAEAAVYILPSYNEGLPVSILEAMAAGLPVVSTPVGGIPDAIRDGEEGFLILPGRIEDLVQRTVVLLKDSALRAEMGRKAQRRLIEEFSSEISLAEIDRIYRECGAQPVE
jgi:glycosyltransferase involved in cell wall biosynthesis